MWTQQSHSGVHHLLTDFGSLYILPAHNPTSPPTRQLDQSKQTIGANIKFKKTKRIKVESFPTIWNLLLVLDWFWCQFKVILTWEPTKNCFAFPQRELVREPRHYVLAPGVARLRSLATSNLNFWLVKPFMWASFVCVFTNKIKVLQVSKVYLRLQRRGYKRSVLCTLLWFLHGPLLFLLSTFVSVFYRNFFFS